MNGVSLFGSGIARSFGVYTRASFLITLNGAVNAGDFVSIEYAYIAP
jgi:hypothetical protein